MSEEFSDDFVVEDEEESGRPFLIAAGSLILIFIIISGVLLAFILNRQRDQSDELSAREATNEAILASNALVQQTADAMAAADRQPNEGEIGEPGDSEEPAEVSPDATPELVPTRDVSSGAVDPENPATGSGDGAGDGTGDGAGDGTGDAAGDGTGDGTGDGAGDGTGDGAGDGVGDGTGDGAGDGTGDGTSDGTGDGAGDSSGDSTGTGGALATPTLAATAPEASELPQTGVGVWGVAVAVLSLLGLLVVARRLRTV